MENFNFASSDDDSWETVVSRKSNNTRAAKPEPKLIEFEELCRTLREILSNYDKLIVAGFVYGSRARRTNRPDSDVDLLIFWKHRVHPDDLKMVRDEIEYALGIKTDFVSCVRTKKYNSWSDDRDSAYFSNVLIDAYRFMGTEYLEDLIPCSIKLKKLGR
jgi:predicted nucleotidyltransferase